MRGTGSGSILEAFKPGTAPPDSYSVIGDNSGGSRARRPPHLRTPNGAVGSGTGGLY